MDKLYFLFFLIAAILLLIDAFAPVRTRQQVRILPLALFFWVLVLVIQTGRAL